MTFLPHHNIFQIRKKKRIDRSEVIGEAKGGARGPHPPIQMSPMIERVTTKPIVYSASVSFSIFAYNSN